MANGSILVVGGESGSNGPPVPTLEILPTPAGGPTNLTMPWLAETDPNNLYPFLMVLPSGGVFVIYYNQARILDEVTFDTIRQLPNLPAAVDQPAGGRTYPMEGTALILPQHAPYTDPITVLVCGGSTPGPAVALDNCVSIQPDVENSTWTLERMVRFLPFLARGILLIYYCAALEACYDLHGSSSRWYIHDHERCWTGRSWFRARDRPELASASI